MAHMIFVDNLIKALQNQDYVIGVFLDFSKAFDTVDHSILLTKLYHYGIRGIAYNWFKGCLLYTSPSPRDRQKSRMPSSA